MTARRTARTADPAAKLAARSRAVARRAAAYSARGPAASLALAGRFTGALGGTMGHGVTVSLFWPMKDEIDVRPLMAVLADRGATLALPVMQGRDRPLLFRSWRPGDALVRAVFGVDEPAETAAAVRPDIVVVPLLAFDGSGNRLGYGGGYYDRTLAALRADGVVLAVGVAYDEQKVENVPADPSDEPLDMVVTDRRIYDFAPAAGGVSGEETE